MGRTLAVANQKGGVAKTTTVASLGAALAELGQRVLLVDLDPQACLTFSLGFDPEDLEESLVTALHGGDPTAAVLDCEERLSLLPTTIELAGLEAELAGRPDREYVVATLLARLQAEAKAYDAEAKPYDWVLLDCPPTLGVLTVAALTAADSVLIPLQCEALAHRGVGQLLDTVYDVREFTNPRLRVLGVLPTMYDGRTTHARRVLENIAQTYQLEVLQPSIPKTIRFAEAPAFGATILSTHPRSRGAQAYRAVAAALLADSDATRPR